MSCRRTRSAARGAAALVTLVVLCGIPRGARAGETALTPHEEYISKYRATSEKPDERAKLAEQLLAEAEAYIVAHPDGAEIVQAKLNKALAIGLYGQRRDEEADKLFEQIRADYPDSPLMPEVMYYHARLFLYAFDEKRLDDARAIQLQLVEKFPTSPKAPAALLGAARSTWWNANDPQGAVKLFERLLKDYPGRDAEVEARANLLSLSAEASDTAGAQAQVDALLKCFTEARKTASPETWQWLLPGSVADACTSIGDRERAMGVLNAVVEAYPGTEAEMRARAELIQISIWRGEEKSALEQIDGFLEQYAVVPEGVPAEAWAGALMSRVADACGRLEAWELLEKCHKTVLTRLPTGDRARDALWGLAWAYGAGFDGRRVEDQLAILFRIAEEYPQTPDAARALMDAAGCYEWRIPDKDKARELYEKVITVFPGTREELDARVHLISMALYAGQDEAAATLIAEYDRLLEAEADQERSRIGQLLLARACDSFYGNNPSRDEFREKASRRYVHLAEAFPGSDEAAEALLDLAVRCTHARELDLAEARRWAFRLLEDNPEQNRGRYVQAVAAIMRNRDLLLAPLEAEMPEKAHDLLTRCPRFQSHESHLFYARADSLHGAKPLEKQIRTIMSYAEERDDDVLLTQALLFMSECYLRKRDPGRALRRLAELTQRNSTLVPEEERRVLQARAFSYLLDGKPGDAIPDLEELVRRAPDPEGNDPDQLRTAAYYEYWLAIARFDQGRYEESASLFNGLTQHHPGTEWADRATQYLDLLLPLLEKDKASVEEHG